MREKREILFFIIGILLSLIIAGLAIYSIIFLYGSISTALDKKSPNEQAIVRFNFEGLKNIGILR
jgi:hypothetical protein